MTEHTYEIIRSEDINELATTINVFISDKKDLGEIWEPEGGLSIETFQGHGGRFYQVLSKKY